MSVSSPHYLLFSEARHAATQGNAWRFVLESVNSQQRLSAADMEPHVRGERLELLAVVRGLEAIDCPARVTLITRSRYVSRGLKYGMNEWRAKNWQWERFGKLVPVRDHDLWRRVDRALQFHQVQCRAWQFASESNPVSRRRTDPSHLSTQDTPSPVDSRARSNPPATSRRSPPRKALSRKKYLARRAQEVVVRLKWSLATWLSEHRLQPLA